MQLAALLPILALVASAVEAHPGTGSHGLSNSLVYKRNVGAVPHQSGGKRMIKKRKCKPVSSTDQNQQPPATTDNTNQQPPATTDNTNQQPPPATDNTTQDQQPPPTTDNTTQNQQTPTGETTNTQDQPPTGGSGIGPPNGIKAGLAGGNCKNRFNGLYGWFTDWEATVPGDLQNPNTYMPMLWGSGHSGKQNDEARYQAFMNYANSEQTAPFFLFLNEPDHPGELSSSVDPQEACSIWNGPEIAKMRARGMLAASAAEASGNGDWLQQFQGCVQNMWDITSIHIYKPSVEEAMEVVERNIQLFGKPILVSELGCAEFEPNWRSCDEGKTAEYLAAVLERLEAHPQVIGYTVSDVTDNGFTGFVQGGGSCDGDAPLTLTGSTFFNKMQNH